MAELSEAQLAAIDRLPCRCNPSSIPDITDDNPFCPRHGEDSPMRCPTCLLVYEGAHRGEPCPLCEDGGDLG